MAWPWLKMLDMVVGLTNVARQLNARSRDDESAHRALATGREPHGAASALETRLPGLMVSALKEVFDRDSERFRVERERLEMERARADRLLRLELARQAADRATARLRMIAGIAAGGWLATFLVTGLADRGASPLLAKVVLAVGWLLLLGAIGTSLAAQARLAEGPADGDDPAARTPREMSVQTTPFWLLLAGLAVSSMTVLLR